MDNGPGWLPDPEHEGQERYWDGSGWTDQVRPTGSLGSLHLPEHVPELQRALAAATADIDQVEDRLSSLFDRTGTPAGAGAVHRTPPGEPEGGTGSDDDVDDAAGEGEADGAEAEAGLTLHEEFEEEASGDAGGADGADEDVDEDADAFAELDAALAAEAPDVPDRRFFRRKS